MIRDPGRGDESHSSHFTTPLFPGVFSSSSYFDFLSSVPLWFVPSHQPAAPAKGSECDALAGASGWCRPGDTNELDPARTNELGPAPQTNSVAVPTESFLTLCVPSSSA